VSDTIDVRHLLRTAPQVERWSPADARRERVSDTSAAMGYQEVSDTYGVGHLLRTPLQVGSEKPC